MRVLARNFDVSDLCTENYLKMGGNADFFALKFSWYLLKHILVAKNIPYYAFTDSVDTFRPKNFENCKE